MGRLIPYLKSAAIWGLVVLSGYMSYQLWFVNITNRSFLPFLQSRFVSTAPDEAGHLVRPYRIVFGGGDGYFDIMYSGIYHSDFWQYGRRVINEVFQNSSFVSQTEIDIETLLTPSVLVYEYAFFINATEFSRAFDRTGTTFANRNLRNFNAMVVHPPTEDSPQVNVFFINSDQNSAWQFNITPSAAQVRDGVFEIQTPAVQGADRAFTSVEGSLSFVAAFTKNFTFTPIAVANPYETQAGLLHLSVIGEQVANFFSNPASITQGTSAGGVYTFSNLTTVVRYHPGDVIEYASFRTIGRSDPTSFTEDFSAAVDFINLDPNINAEFHLAGYSASGRGYIFWFGLTAGNFPLVLTNPWPTSAGCTNPLLHPIEVTVDNGRVVRYRRIAFDFAENGGASIRLDMDATGQVFAFPIGERPFITLQPVEGGR